MTFPLLTLLLLQLENLHLSFLGNKPKLNNISLNWFVAQFLAHTDKADLP